MLSELFSAFEIDDNAPLEVPMCRPDDFLPQIHSKNWFLDKDYSSLPETLTLQAFQAYHVGDYQRAYELFRRYLNENDHNRVHRVGIYESIIRSAIKIEPRPDETLSLLQSYREIATEYGNQLQYWNSAVLVLKNFPSMTDEYLKIVIMLCSSVDSPDHWSLFGGNNNIQAGPNFELGYRIRMLALIDYNISFAAGFVVERLKKKKKDVEDVIAAMKETDERTSQAKAQMVTDLLRGEELQELGEDAKRSAHDCRCKIGVYKTDDAMKTIIGDFRTRFKWMFIGMS